MTCLLIELPDLGIFRIMLSTLWLNWNKWVCKWIIIWSKNQKNFHPKWYVYILFIPWAIYRCLFRHHLPFACYKFSFVIYAFHTQFQPTVQTEFNRSYRWWIINTTKSNRGKKMCKEIFKPMVGWLVFFSSFLY